MNPGASLDERLSALRTLRRHGKASDPVLTSILELARSSEDPVERRKIYAALDGITNPVVMPALVEALGNEQDARAREDGDGSQRIGA
jgi:hypothetical protein